MNDSDYIKRHVAHFGSIAFNYSMCGFILTLGSLGAIFLSWLFMAAAAMIIICYYILIGLGALFSLGLVLFSEDYRSLFNDKGFEWLSNTGDFLSELTPKIMEAVPYAAIVTVILSVISFVCLMFDRKWEKSKARLILLGVITGILLALVIAIFVGIIRIKGGQ